MLLPRMASPQDNAGAIPPPPGVIPNLNHPDTIIYRYNILCQVLCYVSVSACVIARIYTKIYVRPGLKIEDYSCLIAWALAVALSALALSCIEFRGGVHMWEVPVHDVESFLRIQYFGELVYYPAAFFTKTSLLCLIARIFAPNRKAVLLARVIIAIMVLYYVPAFFIKVFRCRPIYKTWIIKAPGECFTDEGSIFLADCIVSLISDMIILVLPMPLVWSLKAPLRRKLRIMVVFAGGTLDLAWLIFVLSFRAAAAIVARTIQDYTLDSEDPTYKVQIIMLLAIAEVNIGIICSCLPILPIFYQHLARPRESSKKSIASSYHRLEALSTSGVERKNLSHSERVDAEAAVDAAVFQTEEKGARTGKGLSVSVLGGADQVKKSRSAWDGDGILKTVDVEQHLTAPERAVLHSEDFGPAGVRP